MAKKLAALFAILFCGFLIGCTNSGNYVPEGNSPPIEDGYPDSGSGDDSDNTDGGSNDSDIPDNGSNDSNPAPDDGSGGSSGDSSGGEDVREYKFYIKAQTDGLNVRSGAGTGFASLGKLDSGDLTVYKGTADGWYITVYRERTAYLSAAYCVVISLEAADERTEAVIDEGSKLVGYPYVYGAARYVWGDGKRNYNFVAGEFDCSSFTQYAFYKGAGVTLELTTREQVFQGAAGSCERGDLLFFTNDSRAHLTGTERIGHVAIYLGGNYILHTASDYAVIEQITAKRWGYFITARKAIN